jgi:hypothetical protein
MKERLAVSLAVFAQVQTPSTEVSMLDRNNLEETIMVAG